jgi:hypothetical protein
MTDGAGETATPGELGSAVPAEFEEARKFLISKTVSAFAATPVLAFVAYLFGLIYTTAIDDFLGVPEIISHSTERVWTVGGLILVLVITSVGIFDKQARRFIRWRRERAFKVGPRVAEPTDTPFVRAAWGSLDEMLFVVLGILLLGAGYAHGLALLTSHQTLTLLREDCVRCETLRTARGFIRGKIISRDPGHLLVMTRAGRFSVLKLDDIQEFSAPGSEQKVVTPPVRRTVAR